MWTGYHYRNSTDANWTNCIGTTGTISTDCYFDCPMIYESVSYHLKAEIHVPAWVRWFDVFRTWAKPMLMPLPEVCRYTMRRVQERYPAQQRARRKRRAYMQALYAI